MVIQAQQVLAHTVAITDFIRINQYDIDTHTLVGHLAEGGALWIEAKTLYPDCVWDHDLRQITFSDGSIIKYIHNPLSTFETTYKAVQA